MKKVKAITKAFVSLAAGSILLFSCDTPEYPSSAAEKNTREVTTYAPISVKSVDAALGEDYARGFDASMVGALEEDGIVYYNENGEAEDIFAILKRNGVNWIRLRIWNDPDSAAKKGEFTYLKEKAPLSHGDNDLERTVKLAKRAKAYGHKLLIDFHYADSWAHSNSQPAPSAWRSLTTVDEVKKAIYDYTFNVIDTLNDAGATPDMVQLGNEIDGYGLLLSKLASGLDGKTNIVAYLNSAASAVRLTAPNAKIMIHSARGGNPSAAKDLFAAVKEVDFDVIGLSYYPFFSSHGNLNALCSNVKSLKETYGKEVVIAETSFAWTDGYNDDGEDNQLWYYSGNDGLNCAANYLVDSDGNLYEGLTTVEYDEMTCIEPTIQNQANAIRAIIEASANAGAEGIFYWGGDMVSGRTFGSTMENQTFFDFNNVALPSLAVFGVKGK